MAIDLVLTPGGFRNRSLVHRVGEGEALHAAEGFVRKLNLATNKLIDVTEFAVALEELPALGSGWITYCFWNNGTGHTITSFETTWTVPAPPSTPQNQTIFLFNGIQNYGQNFGILQPVLQWGVSAAGGGPQWAVASWYVTSGGQAFYTDLIPVNPGDVLIGLMTLTGQSGGLFNYNSRFVGLDGTTLPVQNISELLWCNETLEAYSTNQCSDYPASDATAFAHIRMQTGASLPPLNWTPTNAVQDCGQRAVVVSNSPSDGEIDLRYR